MSSRSLVALAEAGNAPSLLNRTNAGGVPYVAVLAASSLGSFAYLSLQASTSRTFMWLVNLSSAAGLVSWCVLCYTYTKMLRDMRSEGYTREGERLRYQTPSGEAELVSRFAVSGALSTLPCVLRVDDLLVNLALRRYALCLPDPVAKDL